MAPSERVRVSCRPVPQRISEGAVDVDAGIELSVETSRPTVPAARQVLGLVVWLAASFAAAAVGAVASMDAGTFYSALARPAWAPPGWLFGPVWSVLYALMGVSAWLVWRARGLAGARAALSLYLIQLVANALWSWLFFAWHMGGPAFVEILLLWVLILATVIAFRRVSRTAGLLLLPYLVWVAFAAALSWSVWRLNPGMLG